MTTENIEHIVIWGDDTFEDVCEAVEDGHSYGVCSDLFDDIEAEYFPRTAEDYKSAVVRWIEDNIDMEVGQKVYPVFDMQKRIERFFEYVEFSDDRDLTLSEDDRELEAAVNKRLREFGWVAERLGREVPPEKIAEAYIELKPFESYIKEINGDPDTARPV